MVLGAGFIGLEVAEAPGGARAGRHGGRAGRARAPPWNAKWRSPSEAELARLGIEVLTGVAAVGIEGPLAGRASLPEVELVETWPSPLVEPPSLVELVETPSPPAIVRLADGSALPAGA